jgi:fumarate reductase flavoprotein subunit
MEDVVIASNNKEKGISRRSFIAATLGTGVTMMLVGLVGCAPQSTGRQADNPSDASRDGGTYDIIVVGAGGAGMTAALSAHEAGAKVVILEKMLVTGGNTNFAEGGMNASETAVQKAEGIEDSNDLFAQDTFVGGKELGNRELIDFLCKNSNAALERLTKRGMPLTKLSVSGGASVPRIQRPTDGSAVGIFLTTHLQRLCEEAGIAAITNMDVKEIVMEGNKVAGVMADDGKQVIRYNASAVIIAAGGFGANHEMLAGYRPELRDAVTTNQPGAQGDGIRLATAIGADTVDMDQIQVHPTVEQETAILLSEGIRGDGAILINAEGNRFTNELLTRDKVTAAEWSQPGGWSYAVFDKHVYDSNKSIKEKFEANSLLLSGASIESLAEKMNISSKENFISALTTYNDCIEQGMPDPFGRASSLKPIVNPPYYAIKVAPGIHHTMGGLRINTAAEVIGANEKPIPGLFAAGEVTGGIHGGNRLGGNAICDINVFGHRSAESALEYIRTV